MNDRLAIGARVRIAPGWLPDPSIRGVGTIRQMMPYGSTPATVMVYLVQVDGARPLNTVWFYAHQLEVLYGE